MLFFRVILCVLGLVLYLLIREFSDQPSVPTGQDTLLQAPGPVAAGATPHVVPWDSANIGTFQPVAAKQQAQLP